MKKKYKKNETEEFVASLEQWDVSLDNKISDQELYRHALTMMQIDFEERSHQATSYALDRSNFIRISLIIWGIPFILSAALLDNNLMSVDFSALEPAVILLESISFFSAAFVNCISLASIINNFNTTNLSTSGMNYLRALYFTILVRSKTISFDDKVFKALDIENGQPVFKYNRSNSAFLGFYLMIIVNILFGVIGTILIWLFNSNFLFIGVVVLLVVMLGSISPLFYAGIIGSNRLKSHNYMSTLRK